MSVELETGLPSIRQVQTLIKDRKEVELKLLTGDQISGNVLWQDPHCICVVDQSAQPTVIWRHAIAYLKFRN